ncbi:uncharacterized protein [Chlorocebus sabaeus]|uniref:uncharacterized protein n=1 Tax=Chlorocebus sabaeus TaxID=60711 RepID=UPI003BFA0BCC
MTPNFNELSKTFLELLKGKNDRVTRAGFFRLLPPLSTTKTPPGPASRHLPAPWDGEGVRRLPSSVLSRSPTVPAADRKAASSRSSYKQSKKSANIDRCHFSNLPPPTGSPAPFRQAHVQPRRIPVGLKRRQAGGAGVVMEGAGRSAEPLLAELAPSRNLGLREVEAPRFRGRDRG